ncbi:hypothetical protein HUU40_31765 [candidate division KSB1 bacterium]|nr:hypothetical protein [candidate division KSB1 bacterium]
MSEMIAECKRATVFCSFFQKMSAKNPCSSVASKSLVAALLRREIRGSLILFLVPARPVYAINQQTSNRAF